MIDPAIIDLMHHLTTPPAVIEQQAAVRFDAARHPEDGERYIARIEAKTAIWIDDAEKKIHSLILEYRKTDVNEQQLRYLDQIIEAAEASVPQSVRDYKRAVKMARSVVRHHKRISARNAAVVGMQGTRALGALARAGNVKQEIIFALRALRSELNGSARLGPVFTDPDEMAAYLRAAVA